EGDVAMRSPNILSNPQPRPWSEKLEKFSCKYLVRIGKSGTDPSPRILPVFGLDLFSFGRGFQCAGPAGRNRRELIIRHFQRAPQPAGVTGAELRGLAISAVENSVRGR